MQYHIRDGTVYALDHVDLGLDDGETLGLVDETGVGEAVLIKSIMRLTPDLPSKIEDGIIELEDRDLLKTSSAEIRTAKDNQISAIFQDPMPPLSLVARVREQIAEIIRVREKCTKEGVGEKVMEMLETVGIPAERAEDFPHQFPGGVKQRVITAIALAYNPKVLIADEPTMALDVTIRAQVLEMMRRLKDKHHMAVLLITYDLGVVAQMCGKAAIMHVREVVEGGTVLDIYEYTLHPRTGGLLGAIPQVHLRVCRLDPIDGLMPNPMARRTGRSSADRCKYAPERCRIEHPRFIDTRNDYRVCCSKAGNELRKGARR